MAATVSRRTFCADIAVPNLQPTDVRDVHVVVEHNAVDTMAEVVKSKLPKLRPVTVTLSAPEGDKLIGP
jgi:hypothetical protein